MTDMTTSPPKILHFLQADRLGGMNQLFQLDERWLAPVAVFDIAQGFGEDVWTLATPVSTLAMRLSGAPVTCHWGKHNGRMTRHSGVTFEPRGVPNHYSAAGRIRFAHIILPDRLIDRVADGMGVSACTQDRLREDLVFLADTELERHYAEYLHAASDRASLLEIEARAILITARLLRAHHGIEGHRKPSAGGLAPWQLARVCEAMEAHIETDIALGTLARIAGVSATHFSRAFKQSTGLPPFAWLTQRRIARAKALLTGTALSLAEIALATGFAAQPQFTTAFRREVGATPGAWRREHRG